MENPPKERSGSTLDRFVSGIIQKTRTLPVFRLMESSRMKWKSSRRWLLRAILSTLPVAAVLSWSRHLSGCSCFGVATTSTTTRTRPPPPRCTPAVDGTRFCGCLRSSAGHWTRTTKKSSAGKIHHAGASVSSSSSASLWSSSANHDNENENDHSVENTVLKEERFSVAPMMGHTHRHYHAFFSRISQCATLYTEMIPAAQVVAAFQQQFSVTKGTPTLEQVLDLLASSPSSPSSSSSWYSRGGGPLDCLLQMANLPPSPPMNGMNIKQPIVLQLGGSDPQQLALASAIGAHYGYDSLNLNCGCPSNPVSAQGGEGRSGGGAALMRNPSLAAACVEAMSQAIDYYYYHSHACNNDGSMARRRKPTLSVKHRLGVHDAATYDAQADRARSDGDYQAFLQCRDFVRAISLGGEISKVQVHARLGLLGDYDPGRSSSNSADSLWVPGRAAVVAASTDGEEAVAKVDHKRLQYKARKRARKVTIQNRSVPPLRPNVVDDIAAEFPQLQVIANGGIRSMQDIANRVPRRSESKIIGAMVGRAVINHPCAFGNVDTLWDDNNSDDKKIHASKPTREAVLLDYMEYCKQEEDAFNANNKSSHHQPESHFLGSLSSFRRRLMAVPFHLFAGEDGNEEYQRRIRKLARLSRHSSFSILAAALAAIPAETALKPVNEYSKEIEDIPTFEEWTKRAGPLQRTIS
jgi:tRNA-dihydrouridine synthase